jgi:hypothetical protein
LALHLVTALLARHDTDERSRDQDDHYALDTDDVKLSQDIAAGHPKARTRDPNVPHQKTDLPGVLGN